MSHVQVGQITNTRGGLGGSFCRRIVLTHADILVLPTTVPLLVPAVDGKLIVPFFISFKLDPWFADYTNINGAAKWGPDYPSGILAGASGTRDTPSFALANGAAAIDCLDEQFGFSGDAPYAVSDIEGLSLGLVTDNDVSGNFTGGNSGNVLTVTIFYNIF